MAHTKFIDRFIEFFLIEQRLKWKVYLTSVAVASVWALLRYSFFGKSEDEISLEAAIVLCFLVTVSSIAYITKSGLFPAKAEDVSVYPRFSPRFVLAGVAGLVLIAAMIEIDVPKIQATIINLRLSAFAMFLDKVQAATLPESQLRDRYKKIDSIVSVSSKNQIPIDPALLQKTQNAVTTSLKERSTSEQTRQLGWTTSIDLESLAYTRKVQTGAITPASPREMSNTGGYMFNSIINVNNRNVAFVGDYSWIALAPGAEFALHQSNVVFDRIDFLGISDGPAIGLVDDLSTAMVRDSILQNVGQGLDRITWVDVRFKSSRIYYYGGALRLRNVSFVGCDLSHLGLPWGNPVSFELKKRIEEAKGQPVTFIYEPQPK